MRFVAYPFTVAIVLLCSQLVAHVQTVKADIFYSAAADFSANANPAGVWSYGETINPLNDASFIRYQNFAKDTADAAPANLLDAWFNDGPSLSIPAVLHNGTAGVVQFTNPGTSTVIYQPGELAFHPGPSGELSVIRFTAPQTSLYSLQSFFRPVDTGATTNVSIVANGGVLFSGDVDPGSPISFNGMLALAAGQNLDLAVGARGGFASDTTGASILLTAVPEPGSVSLIVAVAIIGLFARLRRGNCLKRRTPRTGFDDRQIAHTDGTGVPSYDFTPSRKA